MLERGRCWWSKITVENYCTVSKKAPWQAHIVYDRKVELVEVPRNEEFNDDKLGFFDIFGSAKEIRVDFFRYEAPTDAQREARLAKSWKGYAAEDLWKAIIREIDISSTHAAYLGYLLNDAERLLAPEVSQKKREDQALLSDGSVIL